MTQQKHLKQLVRARMTKTGERYAAARRLVLIDAPPRELHYPGCVPGATALRILLARAGVRDPRTKRPFSEAMTFGLAGGVGIGVFSFYYEKENFASFFLASRHLWHDHVLYFSRACERLGLKPEVRESTAPKAAEKQLREMLDKYGACVAWCNGGALPHRGQSTAGGYDYHIVTVYGITGDTALIGDLTDEPIEVPLQMLTAARGQIRKDKHRLLAIPGVKTSEVSEDLGSLVAGGLRACHAGLNGDGAPKPARKNFSLEALKTWADRLTSTKDKERWERVFAPGGRLWMGLTWIHLCIDYWSNGGGLARPMMADFLTEAVHTKAAQGYTVLGKLWSELADAALPDHVAEFAEVKSLRERYAELFHSGGAAADKQAVWQRLAELQKQVDKKFPLTDAECAELRARLRDRVLDLHSKESAAHAALPSLADSMS